MDEIDQLPDGQCGPGCRSAARPHQIPSFEYSEIAAASGKICLHENHISPARGGNTLQVPDQSSREASTPV